MLLHLILYMVLHQNVTKPPDDVKREQSSQKKTKPKTSNVRSYTQRDFELQNQSTKSQAFLNLTQKYFPYSIDCVSKASGLEFD